MTILNTRDLVLDDWSVEKRNKNLYVWKKTIGRGRNAKPS